MFVLRKIVFLTKMVKDQNLVAITERFVHIVIRLDTQLIFVSQPNNVTTQEDNSVGQYQIKHNSASDLRITQNQFPNPFGFFEEYKYL